MKIRSMFQWCLVVFCLSCSALSWGGPLGDANGDGKIGLEDSIYTLQIASGFYKPQWQTGQIHTGTISQNETWTTEENPHFIKGTLTVAGKLPDGSPVKLTIQPGVIIQFMEGAAIEIGKTDSPGTLKAVGTGASGIIFTSDQTEKTKGWWNYIRFNKQAVDCEMSFCTVEYGGGYDSWDAAGNIVIYDITGDINSCNVKINNCTITDSATNGVRFANEIGLALFSNNTITNNGKNDIATYGKYGICLSADQVRGIDATNSVAGNFLGGVYISKGTVENDATWHKLDAPYILANATIAGKNGPVVTIEAGTEIRFTEDAELEIGTTDKPGTLIAKGTLAEPIIFTSNQTSKTKGWWNYIRFNKQAARSKRRNIFLL